MRCLGCQWSCDRKRRGVHRATAHYDGSCIRNFKSCLLTPQGSSGLMYLSARTPEIALSSATFSSGGVIYHNVYSNRLLVWAILLATSSSRHWKNPESRNLEQKTEILVGGVPWRTGELPTPVTWPVLGLITSHFKANLLREELVTLWTPLVLVKETPSPSFLGNVSVELYKVRGRKSWFYLNRYTYNGF